MSDFNTHCSPPLYEKAGKAHGTRFRPSFAREAGAGAQGLQTKEEDCSVQPHREPSLAHMNALLQQRSSQLPPSACQFVKTHPKALNAG